MGCATAQFEGEMMQFHEGRGDHIEDVVKPIAGQERRDVLEAVGSPEADRAAKVQDRIRIG